MTFVLELLALLGLILLNAFFVAAEYGLVTSRRTRIMELEHAGQPARPRGAPDHVEPAALHRGDAARRHRLDLAIGALGEQVLAHKLDAVMATVLAVILALLIITYLHVVIGELVPKGIALGHPERTALAVSSPVRWFFIALRPLIWLLQTLDDAILRLLGLEPPGAEHEAHSEAELRMLLSSSAEQGEIEHGEQEMLYKVFDFADKEVSDVMVPRPEVVAISVELPPRRGAPGRPRLAVHALPGLSRVARRHRRRAARPRPDRGDARPRPRGGQHRGSVRPAYMVPETKDLAALLSEFRRTNQHLAVVIDEYGSMEGIVTLEDLLEEIVGEIEDEFDLPDESVERVDDDTIRIDGTFPIDDFNERFGCDLPLEDYHTVAGFVFGQLGRAAEPGRRGDARGLASASTRSRGSGSIG